MGEEGQKNINTIRKILLDNGYTYDGVLHVDSTLLLKFTNGDKTIGLMQTRELGQDGIAVITKQDKFEKLENKQPVLCDFIVSGFKDVESSRAQFVKLALAHGIELPNEKQKLVEVPKKKNEIL